MLLLLRMSMPLEYRARLELVLGDLRYALFHRIFDFVFVGASIVTVCALAAIEAGERRQAKMVSTD